MTRIGEDSVTIKALEKAEVVLHVYSILKRARERDVIQYQEVRTLMKQPDLGEYSDTCWYVRYLADAEFSRKREPFVASCKKPSALKNWFVVNRLKTQWDLGVR